MTGNVNTTALADLLVANFAGIATPSPWFAGLTSSSPRSPAVAKHFSKAAQMFAIRKTTITHINTLVQENRSRLL